MAFQHVCTMRHGMGMALLLVMTLAVSCTPPARPAIAYERTGEVLCTAHDQMTATFHSKSVASTLGMARTYAEMQVFDNLLYKGVPNSNQEIPLLEEKQRSPRTDAFVRDFMESGKYREFMMQSETVNHSETQEAVFAEQKVQVDTRALRVYLENNQIIRKFGL